MRATVIPVAGVLCAASACAVHAATIDVFSGTQSGSPLMLSRDMIGSSSVNETFVLGAIGDERKTTLTGIAFADAGIDRVDVGIFPANGLLDYASSAGATGKLGLTYPNPPGDLNADFTADSLLRIELTQYDFAAGSPMRVFVTLEDGTDQSGVSKMLTSAGAQSIDFLFSDFPPSLILSDIQSVLVEFRPGQSTDFRVDSITTEVPEPASITLLLAGAIAVTARRRRNS